MDFKKFYQALYAPLVMELGPADEETIMALIGFDMGGPLNFCTFGAGAGKSPITYVSCELAVRPEQQPNASGRYELLSSCDSEEWVRSILSDVGRMSLDVVFDDGHTMDIGPWVDEGGFRRKPPLQGLLFKRECAVEIDGNPFCILRCIGITRKEMEFAQEHGSAELVSRLQSAGVYPHTLVNRASVL